VFLNSLDFVYWQDGHDWIGYLDEFPDYMTQGESFKELKENLTDLYQDLTTGSIPNIRRRAKLDVP
jgi:predicted RNase H-like HicB family nuclease